MIHVLIVASVRVYGEALARAVRLHHGVGVVGVVTSLQDAVWMVQRFLPTIVLVDVLVVHQPDAVRSLFVSTAARFVALGVIDEEHFVVEYAAAGFSGYVTGTASPEELVEALERVGRGEFVCSARAAASLLHRLALLAHDHDGAVGGYPRLTDRERDVAGLLRSGRTNKEIARDLQIGLGTVKTHVHSILEKLKVQRRGQAAALLGTRSSVSSPRLVDVGRVSASP